MLFLVKILSQTYKSRLLSFLMKTIKRKEFRSETSSRRCFTYIPYNNIYMLTNINE